MFPATWKLEAAEQICSDEGLEPHEILDLLSRLVDKSLVIAEIAYGERRYRLLETVRQYALMRFAEAGGSARLSERHFAFFFTEFRDVLRLTRHHEQPDWLRRLQMEQENVRAALEWALARPALADQAVELAGALFWYWTKRAFTKRAGCGLNGPSRWTAACPLCSGHVR